MPSMRLLLEINHMVHCSPATVSRGGVIYLILRLGKLLFGSQKIPLPPGTRLIFGEHGGLLPDRLIPYEEIFYRESDTVRIQAHTVELVDRGYREVAVRLKPKQLQIGQDTFNPEEVGYLEVTADRLDLPREAMGLGDVKFMVTLGAFLGWLGAVFALCLSAMLGAVIGLTLILLGKQSRSNPLPYGPFIALGALVWVFFGPQILWWWLH